MYRSLIITCLLSLLVKVQSTDGNPVTNEILCDDELLLAIVVNRHGERSPDADELSLSDQQEKIKNLTSIEGPEGLTNTGKRRAYQIGKFYKQRYGASAHGLISDIYYRDEISIRSTEKERTKMTVQVAMAATYPPEPAQQWDEAVGKVWQPVPYTAVPLEEDYLRYYSNCDKFMALMEEAKDLSINEEFRPYSDLIQLLDEKTGRNFTENPLLFQVLFDLFKSTIALGLEIPDWATPILPKLNEAATLAYRLYFRNDLMKKIGGGVLLNTFIETADSIISEKPTIHRLKIYSAHDFNVGALMEVAQVKNDHSIPEYGAVFALELYRSKKTGGITVLPVLLPQAGNSSPQRLRIIGCEQYAYCDYKKFRNLVKEYLLKEKDYYRICNIRTEL